MRQMNVPHPAHGYPSDARSSFPHEPQLIASRSWSLVIPWKILNGVRFRVDVAKSLAGTR